jgi:fibronectin-binding autotransporter adhesin
MITTPNTSIRRLGCLLALLATTVAAVHAQVVTQSFMTSSAPGWTFSGSGFSPTLTSGNGDPVNSGWLQMANNGGNEATAAVYNSSFNSAGATVYATFNYQMYGGSGGNVIGGDGLTFFLYDATKTFSVGAYGGSMGYAQKTGINGLSGGYIGVGLDAFGNYSNPTEGRVGGVGSVPEAIAVRGPGSGTSGYTYLGGSSTLSTTLDSATRPTTPQTVQILLTATNQLTVTLQQGGTSPQTVLQMDLSGYARPDLMSFGFTAGSGGATDFINLNNLNVTTVAASLWSNTSGNSAWATNTNWNPTVVPTSGSDILFDNTYVNTAQTVDTGANRSVRSVSFDAPLNYTVNNNTLTFDSSGVAGFSGIAVTQTHGTGIDTINSNLALNNAINIRNNATGTLSVTGNIAAGANTITLDGTGTSTNLSGIISGSGNVTTGVIVKNDSGTVTLSGSNTYTGNTTINNGTLNANSATAFGTSKLILTGGTLGSTNNSTITNTIALTGNATLSGLTSSGTLTETGANLNLTLVNATQSGAVNLSDSTTAHTLTAQVDSGTSTIGGVIANGGGSTGGGLTKTGAGTLILSGNNTYTGTTTISNGTIQLGASDRLADASQLNIGASGTLNLGGFSEKVGALTVAGGATLDFGTATGNNTFLFGTYNAPASGVFVVNNWTGNTTLATTVIRTSQPNYGTANPNINNSIYISGYGLATEAAGLSNTIYGTNSAYLLTPAAQTWKYWDGSTTTWGGANYWSSTASPTFTSTPTPNGQGTLVDIGNFNTGVSATPTLTGNVTLGGIRFDPAATQSYNVSGNSTTRTLTMSQAAGPAYIQQQSGKDQTISVGTLALTSSTVADLTGSGNLTISSAITGTTNLIKDGTVAGKLILTGNNSALTGGVYINNGIVQAANANALGAGATTVLGGAALELSGVITVANAISVAGSGVGGAGAIHNVSGNNTLSGTLTETSSTTIAADTGTLLTMSGTLTGANTATTFAGAGNINAALITTGTGTVDINSTGNVTFSGATANTYTGNTTVNSGTLILGKTAGVNAVAGNLTINGGAVTLAASNQIADTASVTLNNTSAFNLNGNAETLGQLNSTSTSAVVALGAGALTFSGPNNTNSNYAGTITGTAASSITVNGSGKVYLSGNNSGYSGNTSITNGTLNASGSNNVLGTGNVSISGTGNLQLQGGITLANAIAINGTGTSGNGAIENFAGNNAISGNITLGGASRIQSDAGTLIVGQSVILGANTLNVGGAGTTSITGLIAGAGGLTKDGTGTLSLGNSGNTFAGATIISAGTVLANATNVFNNTAALTVATGASLSLQTYSEKVGSLTGGGLVDFGTSGSLTLSSGSATFSGSFAGSGTLIIGPGASLTLGANFSDPNLTIQLAGGSLYLNGTNSTFGTLNITGNSILDFGNTTNSTLNVNNVTFSATNLALSVTNWTNVQDYFYSQNFTGAVPNAHGQTPENQITFSGFTAASTSWLSNDHQITPAPEPATYGMIFVGLSVAAVGLRRLRRSRQPAKAA